MSLADLVAAYDRPQEGSGRVALLEEMEALGAGEQARTLAASADAGERRLAARLMELLPDRGHLEALRPLVLDDDERVAAAARHALRLQPRTAEWRAAVGELSGAPDGSLRAAAAEWLSEA